MNQDELIEKCRLTGEEVKREWNEAWRKQDCSADLDDEEFKVLQDINEAQLRKAIPIIEAKARKAERERVLAYLLAEPRSYEFETYYSIILKKSELQALKGEGDV